MALFVCTGKERGKLRGGGDSCNKTSKGLVVVQVDNGAQDSLFVVHTDEKVVFVSDQLDVADAWLKENREKFDDNLRLFLVPSNFGQVRLRMAIFETLRFSRFLKTPSSPQ